MVSIWCVLSYYHHYSVINQVVFDFFRTLENATMDIFVSKCWACFIFLNELWWKRIERMRKGGGMKEETGQEGQREGGEGERERERGIILQLWDVKFSRRSANALHFWTRKGEAQRGSVCLHDPVVPSPHPLAPTATLFWWMKQESEAQWTSPTQKAKQGHPHFLPPVRSSENHPFSPRITKRCSTPKEGSQQPVHPQLRNLAEGRLNKYKLLARDLEAVIFPEDLRTRAHYLPSVSTHEQWGHGPPILSTPSLHDTAEKEYTSPRQGCLMLARVWTNSSSCTALAGAQTDAAMLVGKWTDRLKWKPTFPDANQTQSEISSHTCYDAYHQK